MKIELTHAHVIDPANAIDEICNLYILDKKIAAVGTAPEGWQSDKVVDLSGHTIIPGMVDIATHLREPGQEHKATIASETFAGVASGITSMVCSPDTNPVIDTPAEVEFIQQRSQFSAYCHVYVMGALTTQLKGDYLSEMAALKEAGVVGVSNALHPFANNLVLRRAMEYAASQDLTVFFHPHDHYLAANGCIHEGANATRMGLPGIPTAAETAAASTCLSIIEDTNVRVHFCRISSQRTLQMLERALYDGAPISADVCMHQLFLSDEDIQSFDSNYHVIPPLRSRHDVNGLRARLGSNALMCICSDHQPHEPDAKLAPFPTTEPGISSLETLLPLTLKLSQETSLSLSDAIALVTSKPAQLLGIDAGQLSIGAAADICVFDAQQEWQLTADNIHSEGKNTPFLNQTLQGRVTHTFVEGELVYQLKS
jgi:dihydroorotase